MSVKDLREALHGPKGAMDGYLELCNEAEIKADILALCGNDDRKTFAAMAMQAMIGTAAAPCIVDGLGGAESHCATSAVKMADALIAELAK